MPAPEPFPLLTTDGVAFIAREETGGLAYYRAVTRWPHYPGLSSGITIGIGYDLRFNTKDDFRELWGPHLPAPTMDLLETDIGRPGSILSGGDDKDMNLQPPGGTFRWEKGQKP